MNGVLPFHGKREIQGLKSRIDGVENCRMEGKTVSLQLIPIQNSQLPDEGTHTGGEADI